MSEKNGDNFLHPVVARYLETLLTDQEKQVLTDHIMSGARTADDMAARQSDWLCRRFEGLSVLSVTIATGWRQGNNWRAN